MASSQTNPLSEASKSSTIDNRLPPTWLLNNYISTRGGCNYLAQLAAMLPPTESTLRDKALRTLYTLTREFCNKLEQAAYNQNLAIPALPPISENYEDEAALPRELMIEIIKPHAHDSVNEILGYNTSLARDKKDGGCGWEVLTVALCESNKQFEESLKEMGDAAGTRDVGAILRFYGQLGWENSADSIASAQCLAEASARLRKEKGEAWWTEEAEPVIARNKTLLASYKIVGIEQYYPRKPDQDGL
ncbi:uncharacterized protein H6S33_002843 [Morchella sextelata]|uniref:uncharacterized protein n=1 Tax=Morchella sextelata TaxID=1174677 RepID=UPI001D038195|nr:uncharacterized protein H6S33_002843 [Morchella sextelata]KAH0607809.1 hypothetical protein H6S33_002843 [Morchella sextelata]